MTDIDLTEAVTNAARRDRQAVIDQYANLYPDTPTLDAFDDLPILEQNIYREKVLPLIWAAHRDIARQAWDEGCEAGTEDVLRGLSYPGALDPTRNPYEESRP